MKVEFNDKPLEITQLGEKDQQILDPIVANISKTNALLIGNIYQEPLSSSIREIVSNAMDANTEAKRDEPIIIVVSFNEKDRRISEDTTENYIEVRDFGNGISPEVFENVFTKFGESTKSHSDEAIGGFGIGRFAPLNLANFMDIETVHEGMQYRWLLKKVGLSLQFIPFKPIESTEPSGTKVRFPIPYEYDLAYTLAHLSSVIAFQDNILIVPQIKSVSRTNEEYSDILNSYRVQNFGTFSISTLNIVWEDLLTDAHGGFINNDGLELCPLIGNIPYIGLSSTFTRTHKNNMSAVEYPLKDGDTHYRVIDYPLIGLHYGIDELNPTPSRESIVKTSDTNSIMEKRELEFYAKFLPPLFKEKQDNLRLNFLTDFSSISEMFFRYVYNRAKSSLFSFRSILPLPDLNLAFRYFFDLEENPSKVRSFDSKFTQLNALDFFSLSSKVKMIGSEGRVINVENTHKVHVLSEIALEFLEPYNILTPAQKEMLGTQNKTYIYLKSGINGLSSAERLYVKTHCKDDNISEFFFNTGFENFCGSKLKGVKALLNILKYLCPHINADKPAKRRFINIMLSRFTSDLNKIFPDMGQDAETEYREHLDNLAEARKRASTGKPQHQDIYVQRHSTFSAAPATSGYILARDNWYTHFNNPQYATPQEIQKGVVLLTNKSNQKEVLLFKIFHWYMDRATTHATRSKLPNIIMINKTNYSELIKSNIPFTSFEDYIQNSRIGREFLVTLQGYNYLTTTKYSSNQISNLWTECIGYDFRFNNTSYKQVMRQYIVKFETLRNILEKNIDDTIWEKIPEDDRTEEEMQKQYFRILKDYLKPIPSKGDTHTPLKAINLGLEYLRDLKTATPKNVAFAKLFNKKYKKRLIIN